MSEGPQVLSSNSYQGEPLLRGVTVRTMSIDETQVEQLSKKTAALGGQTHHCQKSMRTETSGSPREETRLLGSLCIELAKGQRDTWAGLYTSPMGAFLSERTIVR